MPPDHASDALTNQRPSIVEARVPREPADATTLTLETDPLWPLPPDHTKIEWEIFARFPNYLAAEIVAGLFQNEGLPSIVQAWNSVPGVGTVAVWVPKFLMHRARWIVALAPPTDAELLFLATGELSSTSQPE
jgi:hypothetical protein